MPLKTSAKKRKAPEPNPSPIQSLNATPPTPGRSKSANTYSKPPTPSEPESSQQVKEQCQSKSAAKNIKENNTINVTTLLGSFKRQTLADKVQVRLIAETQPLTPSDAQLKSTRNKLGTLLDAILNTKPFKTGFQVAYELCQNICLYGESEGLYTDIYSILDKHILHEKDIIMAAMNQDDFLDTLDRHWSTFCDQLVLIRNVFMELERRYIMHETPYGSIIDLGKQMFKRIVMEVPQVQSKTIQSLLHLIQSDRDGIQVDLIRARSVTRMMLDLSLYAVAFEPSFMEATVTYYGNESTKKLRELQMPEYILHASERVRQESELRIDAYLDHTTKASLTQAVIDQLVYSKVDAILDQGFDKMMTQDDHVPLRVLYHFLLHNDRIVDLRVSFTNYIKKHGLQLIQDPANDPQMVPVLLQYKKKLDLTMKQSFDNNSSFSNSLKESFESFINSRKGKPAEMLAKFIDSKLRSGNKKQQQHQEEKLEETLDGVLVLFRYLQGKDVFEAFYRRFLSKRLLLNRSVSNDKEKNLLSKIRTECGPDFTRNLENMFKDMEISADLNTLFKASTESSEYAAVEKLPITVNVLAQIVWPTYSTTDILLPTNMLHLLDAYRTFYASQFKGRKLIWRNSMGSCVLTANFPKGRKEISVSLFQAIVLMLFNDTTNLTLAYSYIANKTKLDDDELKRVLQSLSCGKHKLLFKNPPNNTITGDDVFQYNNTFTAPVNRIKINSIQQEQTTKETNETHTKVLVDRQYQLEAAIVRIMKSKKHMTHMALVNELFDQLKFPIEAADIKKRIESLIDRDYLSRNGTDSALYHYQS